MKVSFEIKLYRITHIASKEFFYSFAPDYDLSKWVHKWFVVDPFRGEDAGDIPDDVVQDICDRFEDTCEIVKIESLDMVPEDHYSYGVYGPEIGNILESLDHNCFESHSVCSFLKLSM